MLAMQLQPDIASRRRHRGLRPSFAKATEGTLLRGGGRQPCVARQREAGWRRGSESNRRTRICSRITQYENQTPINASRWFAGNLPPGPDEFSVLQKIGNYPSKPRQSIFNDFSGRRAEHRFVQIATR
jgi:hypothetical protein